MSVWLVRAAPRLRRLRRARQHAAVWVVRVRMVRVCVRVQIVRDHRRVAARSRVRRHRSPHHAPEDRHGVVAIGNIAVGVLAIGGAGLRPVHRRRRLDRPPAGRGRRGAGAWASRVGGFAVGSIAIGGAAMGFLYAIGGGAFGPAVIDGRQCDEAARDFARRWLVRASAELPMTRL